MKGTIAFANSHRGRYAVLTEDGDYTIFELLEGAEIEFGETMSGDFNAAEGQTFRGAQGQNVSVSVEDYHCSRAVALRWVSSI